MVYVYALVFIVKQASKGELLPRKLRSYDINNLVDKLQKLCKQSFVIVEHVFKKLF